MSNLPPHLARRLDRLVLQDLIDYCTFAVFADYDLSESIDTRAIVVHHDGFHRVIGLHEAQSSFQLQPILQDAVTTITALGGRMGYALVYVQEKGRELVFLAAINEREKGICAVELKRGTGDPLRDFLPVHSDAICSFLERLEWGGTRRKVAVEIMDEIRV
jgi:hypothetical protein